MQKKILILALSLITISLVAFKGIYQNNPQSATNLKPYQMVSNITDANFDKEIAKGVVLVDFWASWCGPCRRMAPVIEEIASQNTNKNIKICKLDVDANKATSRRFQVASIPSFLIFKNGQLVETFVGMQSKDVLVNALAKHSK